MRLSLVRWKVEAKKPSPQEPGTPTEGWLTRREIGEGLMRWRASCVPVEKGVAEVLDLEYQLEVPARGYLHRNRGRDLRGDAAHPAQTPIIS